ncbi:hypothetical protein J5N97_015533 [Dioscorea zingiberensis]|uniref:SKP1 component dimerisation domain-containing protein n=1 Tax=Dioscorea zingiberensis TaxID=325984 RepID=A0A9D5HKP1_9LILI|nr:hypothetical protein J5N97_015533 [Dioscorea zingiberensis]
MASLIRGRSPDEIRKLFNIKYDFTPEQEEEIRMEMQWLRYVEQELAKKKGKKVDAGDKEEHDPVDQLYVVPEHLKVKKRNSEESSTQWTTGIAEVQLPIEGN